MRWEYTAPEKKLFVSDGHKIYSYIPQDKQVIVSTMPQDDQAPTPALFLTGKGNITRDFTVAFDKVADAPAGAIALKLTPETREPEYESLTLVVEPKTLRLQMLITVDAQGGRSAFTFSNLKENVGLADNQFVFQMPRNVDVVTDGRPVACAVPRRAGRWVAALAIAAALAGCATAGILRDARRAEERRTTTVRWSSTRGRFSSIPTTSPRAPDCSAPSCARRRTTSRARDGWLRTAGWTRRSPNISSPPK